MKKRIIILSVFVCLGIGGFFVWNNFLQKTKRNAVDVISAEALFVFETEEPVLAWNRMVSQTFWKSVSEIPSLKNAEYNLLVLDSLAGKSGILQKNLKGNQLTVSLHPIGKGEFDFLYVLAYQSPESFYLLEQIEKKIKGEGKINSRNYSGINIKELKSQRGSISLTYAKVDNLLILSFTSFLVEDAIRHSQNEGLLVFSEYYEELFKASPQAKGLGLIRIGSDGLSGIINGISADNDNSTILNNRLNKFSANLQMDFAEENIFLDGVLFLNGKKDINLQNLKSPAINSFKNLISTRTATYFQYQIEDPFLLFSGFESDFPFNSIVMGDIETGLIQKSFAKYLTGHIALLNLEKLPNQPQDKILLLKTENPNVQMELLKKFGFGENQDTDISRFSDIHQGKDIYMIRVEEFPAHLFNGSFIGFGSTYFTAIEDVIVIANSSKAIKLFLDEWKSGKNWSQSVNYENIIPKLENESGFSMVLDVQKVWETLEEAASSGWKSFFQRFGQELKTFDMIFLKTIHKGNEMRIQIEISHKQKNLVPSSEHISLIENTTVPFPNHLIFGPVGIRNFNDNSIEFVVQDEVNRLYLLTNEGEEVFSYDLDGPIISEVFQLDFYKNGKLQLLFATKEKIYGIDRMGQLLPDFPLTLSRENIAGLNLLDYEGDRNYRIFASTEKGDLFLYDKYGTALEGWNPKPIGTPLAVKPAHHRVAGLGDRMIALGNKGNIHFFNRRGEAVPGSPVQIKGELRSDYVLLERGTAKETQLVTVTKDGEVVMVNLLGEITFRNQLFRPDRESRFYLIKDQLESRYLFVVHEYNKITVLDSEYNEVFSKPIMSEELRFQYFSFGSERDILVVVDPTQEFIFLYGLDGELLNPIPINGNEKVEIEYSESQNEYTIYAIGSNGFSVYKLPM
ncbi:hypothetical protein MMU07_00440 [Aquiflexum sp. LQ15W]|uniref:hypothetical protein n=1 Tax=Cognataquiflexum nitidum TaxID=2922272 RepID=UPI001F1345D0|nr:hypothetical protein [Cognataquiflexum nitidum]MCH6198028.1 hypothetical protein [Cognataquiflexum nitidum]